MIEQRIQNDMKIAIDFLCSSLKKDLVALVLMGGYARGEGTTLDGKNPYNDYDLLVVGPQMSYYNLKQKQKRCKNLEKQLSSLLRFPIEVAYQSLTSLSRADPSLMNVELQKGHKVLFGPSNCLSVMPSFSFTDIPLVEGTRLLVNRGSLLLTNELKYMIKACLAMGDTWLLLKSLYTISYAEKKKLIEKANASPWLIDHYKKAIRFKLEGKIPSFSYEEIKSHFIEHFFLFEKERLQTPFSDTSSYAYALASSSFSFSIKSLLLNLYLFKHRAFSPSLRWCLHHPRLRLCPALLSLLQKQNPDPWIHGYSYLQLWSRLT